MPKPWRAAAAAAMLTVALFVLSPASALAGTANAGITGAPASDPIAGLTWGYYTGNVDNVFIDYEAATGAKRTLLGEVAMRPEAYWFGNWVPDPKGAAASYIASVTQGNPSVMAQLTDFRVAPWENKVCGKTPSAAAVRSYENWTDQFAAGIGSSRALVVLQPDLPVADTPCMPAKARNLYLQEVAFAANKLSSLKYTTVYLDAGASDWLSVDAVAKLLIQSGIKDLRGFGLDATHFASTENQITYGHEVVKALAARGAKAKHFIIDTSENGSPFNHQQYTKAGGTAKHWASRPGCTSTGKPRFCQTFGIPPTWQVGLPKWKLGSKDDTIANSLVDGYVWFGRPWMKGQSAPFDVSLTEQMAKSTPFPYPEYAEPLPEETDDAMFALGRFGTAS